MRNTPTSSDDPDETKATGSPPIFGRRFYAIHRRDDGAVDVYLMPSTGTVLVVTGIMPWEGMEDDIRARYGAWLASGEAIM